MNLTYTSIQSPVPDFIYEDLREYSRQANRYHSQPQELTAVLAEKHHLDPNTIFLTAGADEGIQLCIQAFGKMTYIFTPTYIVYADVELFGGTLKKISSLKDNIFSISTAPFPDASLILLANPNNPAGIMTHDKVLELVANNPQAIVVVDEAYSEFADESVLKDVTKYPNLIVLRSFSKAYALAGNRIGFMVASVQLLKKIKPLAQWANVSYLSVGAAVSALAHEEYFLNIRKNVIQLREQCVPQLQALGFTCIPSSINAILLAFTSAQEANNVRAFLSQHDIQVNVGNGNSTVGLDDTFIRMAVGTQEQMQEVLKVLKQLKKS